MATATTNGGAAKPESEIVLMQDGRKVEFVGKRKLLKESIPSDGKTGPAVRLDFRNGATVNFVIPETLYEKFALHGAEQKLGDETAGETDVDDMQMAVEELAGRLQKGEWSIKREGGGMSGTSVLLRAMVEYTGRTKEQIKEFLSTKSKDEKDQLRTDGKVRPGKPNTLKAIVERIEAEKLAKGPRIDTDALLASISA